MQKVKAIFSHWAFWTIIGGLFVSALVSIGVWRYVELQKELETVRKTGSVAGAATGANDAEVAKIIAKVGKHIDLPTGETPTVATVADVEKLKEQPFFTNAKNGDRVLVYNQAKKAILYRESTDKIIELAPVVLPEVSPSPADSTSVIPSIQPSPTVRSTPTPTTAAASADSTITPTPALPIN